MKLNTFDAANSANVSVLHHGLRIVKKGQKTYLRDFPRRTASIYGLIAGMAGENGSRRTDYNDRVVLEFRVNGGTCTNVLCLVRCLPSTRLKRKGVSVVSEVQYTSKNLKVLLLNFKLAGSVTFTNSDGEALYALQNLFGELRLRRLSNFGVWKEYDSMLFAKRGDGTILRIEPDYLDCGVIKSNIKMLSSAGWQFVDSRSYNVGSQCIEDERGNVDEFKKRALCARWQGAKELMAFAEAMYPGDLMSLEMLNGQAI